MGGAEHDSNRAWYLFCIPMIPMIHRLSASMFSVFLDYILRVCQSLWDSFLYLGKLHWFLYLLLSYFYDSGMFIFRWNSNFVEKVALKENLAAKMASRVFYLAYYH